MPIKVFSMLLLLTLAMSQVHAQVNTEAQASTEHGYALLENFFNGLQSLQADFEQTVRDSRGNVTDTSRGTLALQKPGKFHWNYAKPNAQTIVSDGKKIWLYDPELEQVTIRVAQTSLQGTPASLLSGEGNLRDSFAVEHVEQRDGMTIINLTPKRSDTDFKRLQLALQQQQLSAMALTDKLGQSTLLQFQRMKRNPKLAASQFTFAVPRGVDVVDNTQDPR